MDIQDDFGFYEVRVSNQKFFAEELITNGGSSLTFGIYFLIVQEEEGPAGDQKGKEDLDLDPLQIAKIARRNLHQTGLAHRPCAKVCDLFDRVYMYYFEEYPVT